MSLYQNHCHWAIPEAYYALDLSFFEMEPHTHDRCELMYVEDGEGTVYVQDTAWPLHTHEFIFLDAGIEHKLDIRNGQRCSILNVEFSVSRQAKQIDLSPLFTQSTLWNQFIAKKKPFFVGPDSYQLGYALKDLITELNRTQHEDHYLLQLQFLRLMIELARCVETAPITAGIHYIRKAEQFIQAHFTEDITVASVVERVKISYSYLQILFSKYHHCGIQTYINNLRIDKAAFLLENSSMKVTDISFFVGFNSRQHFLYTFSKRMQMSPGRYRKLHCKHLSVQSTDTQLSIPHSESELP